MNASATCGRTGDVPKGYEGATGESRANAGIFPGLLRPAVMSQQVSFGHHRFEPASGRLWADQRELRLTRKAASVLGLLLERAGQPVTKQELFASVWGNTVVWGNALVGATNGSTVVWGNGGTASSQTVVWGNLANALGAVQ